MIRGQISLQQLHLQCAQCIIPLFTMPGQLVFGRDMILNTQYLADWTAIKARKQQLIRKNNIIKKSKRIPHQYKMGNMVMLEYHHANKYEQPYKSALTLLRKLIPKEGVHLKIGAVTDTVNIRQYPSIQNDIIQL